MTRDRKQPQVGQLREQVKKVAVTQRKFHRKYRGVVGYLTASGLEEWYRFIERKSRGVSFIFNS